MKLLTKLCAISILTLCSVSAYAYDCVLGGVGHCIWAFDKNDPSRTDLINPTLFTEFCEKNNIYCSAFNNGYNGIVGRYLDGEVFMIAGKGWGGPDLILENRELAEQFVAEFKKVASHSDARFYVKNAPNEPYPTPRIVAIGYKTDGDIKLLFLPNESDETGENYPYVPEDM